MYARKRDLAHAQIVAELRQAGFFVFDMGSVGRGCPDLLISRNGIATVVELKTPKGRKTAADRLGAAQKDFVAAWKGPPVIAAYTASDVVFDFWLLVKRTGAWR